MEFALTEEELREPFSFSLSSNGLTPLDLFSWLLFGAASLRRESDRVRLNFRVKSGNTLIEAIA